MVVLLLNNGADVNMERADVGESPYGARFQTEFCTQGCHWIPRMFA
jgi:hypothetical protein